MTYVSSHYRLHAYVCGVGCTKPSPNEGAITFTLIYQLRPNNCRFAVAQAIPISIAPVDPTIPPGMGPVVTVGSHIPGPYLVWDLLDSHLVRAALSARGGWITPPKPRWRVATLDGAIMKAMMRYDRY